MTSLLGVHHIHKSFGFLPLFDDVSIAVDEGDRVALIGANGSGKSTLLRIIAKLDEPDQGDVVWRRDLAVSYVAQQSPYQPDQTVAEIFSAALSKCDEVEQTIRMSRWLRALPDAEPHTKVGTLSGGQQKRLQLAVGFAMQSDVLLLDEPTNHLDIDGIEWLESLFKISTAALVFITHDRYLIENHAQRVVEIASWYPRGYFEVQGHYSEFLEKRAHHLSVREQTYASMANRARRELAWLRRTPSAQRTKSKSRVRSAEQLISEVSDYRGPEERAGFDFARSDRKSHDLVRVHDLGMAFGNRSLFKNCSFTLSPGVRIGIVGPNGSGKSSLIKILNDVVQPSAGKVVPALGCRFVYFDQHRRTLHPDVTLRQALCPDGDSVSFNGKLIHVTSWAKRFLFKPEHLGKRISALSGGELARATLAHLMREPADVLLLDEPTNDLDISTLEVLEEALQEFNGAVALISHDRYFLDRVCTSLLGILDGAVLRFEEYSQYAAARASRSTSGNPAASGRSANDLTSRGTPSAQKKSLTYGERLELKEIEKKIERAESRLKNLESHLHDPEIAANHTRLTEQWAEVNQARSDVEALYHRWSYLESKEKGA